MQNFTQHRLIGIAAIFENCLEYIVGITLFCKSVDLNVQIVKEKCGDQFFGQEFFDLQPILLIEPVLINVGHQNMIADLIGKAQGNTGGVNSFKDFLCFIVSIQLDNRNSQQTNTTVYIAHSNADILLLLDKLAEISIVAIDLTILVDVIMLVVKQVQKLIVIIFGRLQFHFGGIIQIELVELIDVEQCCYRHRSLCIGCSRIHQSFDQNVNGGQALLAVDHNAIVNALDGSQRLKHNRASEVKLISFRCLNNIFKQFFALFLRPFVVALVNRNFVLLAILAQKVCNNASRVDKHANIPPWLVNCFNVYYRWISSENKLKPPEVLWGVLILTILSVGADVFVQPVRF